MVRILAIQETRVWSSGREDLLEKGMATLSSIIAWEIPWTEEPGGLQSMDRKEWDMTEYSIAQCDLVSWSSPFT